MDGVAHVVPEPAPPANSGSCHADVSSTDDVLDEMLEWVAAGRNVAVATVVKTSGSAPRPVGSQLVVNERMAFAGSVSSGCVESATLRAALEVIADGRPRRLSFGASRDDVFDIGLTCGGELELFIECVTPARALFEELRRARDSHRSLVVATALCDGEHFLFPSDHQRAPGLEFAARDALRRDRSTVVRHDGAEWFLHVRHPPRRLVIIGAVHIAQALAPMAQLNGFRVTVVDPRDAFTAGERFAGIELVCDWPGSVMARLGIDHRTAVVTLAHDTKLDDPALAYAVASNAFYVGALGSRRSHAERLERLASQSVSREHLARIRGPVGLAIGAVTPAEIATSIIADIVQTLRQAPA